MKTEYASEEASSARNSEGITRDEFLELFKAGVREILPESYRLSGNIRHTGQASSTRAHVDEG